MITGRNVLVTGATQGIGRAIALGAARAGAAAVIVGGVDRVRGEAVAAEIRTVGAAAHYAEADLAPADGPGALFAAALDRCGTVDALANCAGVTDRASVREVDPAVWDRVFAINARAPTLLMKELINHLIARGEGGNILNILSMNAYGATPPLAVYAASKAALELLTRNAAQAHRFDRIRINGINLGWVDTPGERDMQSRVLGHGAGWLEAANARQPFGRLLVPADVARLAVFLLGEESFPMTGSIVDQEQWAPGVRDG